MAMKYIVVTGGVISGVGKGVISSSFGTLLTSCGIAVTSIKIDPYINIDAGTFSPYEHGEVFVLDDGGEVDLDLGNYERFLDITLRRDNNITTGKIYKQVIERERKGDYLGKTVQVVPHITDAIQEWVERVAQQPVNANKDKPQVCIVELGGTIGDIEGMPFVEAFRQLRRRVKQENFCIAHVSLVPMIRSTGEAKTKPTQSSVRKLRGLGLVPDLILCRSEGVIGSDVIEKISNYCAPAQVVCIHDLSSIYQVPLVMASLGMIDYLRDRLNLDIPIQRTENIILKKWRDLAFRVDYLQPEVRIALVGKYTKLEDSYTSISKALQHAATQAGYRLKLIYIEASHLEKETKEINQIKYHDAWKSLCECKGVLVPGGFGSRGMEGKIEACRWARTKKIPLLGICLGLQAAVIEYSRNVLHLPDSNSTECKSDCENPIVIDMPEHTQADLGGTMRLGRRKTVFKKDCTSKIKKLYGSPESIDERHRHRYEVNPDYIPQLESHGMKFVGVDEKQSRMEIIELEKHPYYVAVQFHPEYLSRPLRPSAPFMGLILAAVNKLQPYLDNGCQLSNSSSNTCSDDENSTIPIVNGIHYIDQNVSNKDFPSNNIPQVSVIDGESSDEDVTKYLNAQNVPILTVSPESSMKYILVTGGVISGVGKGVVASSIGTLLNSRGIAVTSIKIDPYINIDAGTFSPYEHGEVFVLDDGGEVDLDLGNYERFLDITLKRDNNITTAKIYKQVIERERKGNYLGKTVQVVPHVTDAIQEWVERVAIQPVNDKKVRPQVCIIELGGTIGDIEGMPFVEAFRQFRSRVKWDNFCVAHVSWVPMPRSTGEAKTKPTQSSVRELRLLGLSADLIVCRSENVIGQDVKEKISNFCDDISPEQVICIPDLSSIYHVPLVMESHGIIDYLRDRLKLDIPIIEIGDNIVLNKWQDLAYRIDYLQSEVRIALVGKYTKLEDSYASISKALQHAATQAGYRLKLHYIEACNLKKQTKLTNQIKYHDAWKSLCECQGVLVPGGFGSRGMEGKIEACRWARTKKIPFLGICLGLQAAVIEYSRNVLNLPDSNSTECKSDCENPIVIDMPEHNPGDLGGTMRLGRRKTVFKKECTSITKKLYGSLESIDERHRHRYEVNPKYITQLESNGLKFVGVDESKSRMEIIELENHPYYVAVQFHPEYLSRPLRPSPPFIGLILAAVNKLRPYLDKICDLSNVKANEYSDAEELPFLKINGHHHEEDKLTNGICNGITVNGNGAIPNGHADYV